MHEQALLNEVIEILRDGLIRPQSFWQLAVIAASLVIGWMAARSIQSHISARLADSVRQPGLQVDVLQFSIDGLRRLAFPVAAMVLILLGGLLLIKLGVVRRPLDLQLLRLALTLLAAMGAVRLFVYVMRRSFPRATWLVSFERAIAATIWMLVALHLTGLLADLEQGLESVRLPIGRSHITLWGLLVGALSVVLTVLAALWLGSAIEARLMATKTLAANSRVALARVIKAVLLLLAVLLALAMVGIDLTVLSVFGGALGVGLGLGLQRIASNYVSGFIILIDRSLSIGDMITVDKYFGAVSQINTRYTVIRALDGTETIVPNEMLVASPVVNHSYTDSKVRVAVKVSIAYDANLDRALAILEECAGTQPRVLADPPPMAFLTGFAADGLELEIGFWIRDPEEGTLAVRSGIARAVLGRFRDENIAIPFPQRDIRISAVPDGWQPTKGSSSP